MLLFSCNHPGTEEKAKQKQDTKASSNTVTLTDAQIKNAGIQTGKIEERAISQLLKISGKIDVPTPKHDIGKCATGRLFKIYKTVAWYEGSSLYEISVKY